MSEGNIKGDTLHDLRMEKQPQTVLFLWASADVLPLIVLQKTSLIAQCQLGQNQLDSCLVHCNVSMS